ncbi:MAG: hypothetical protein HYW22_00590 [Candidatus Aenigmarchaeota archaeon]|nr:hypothetical protein [Candidatus Aenigmarchaeota archaeon]
METCTKCGGQIFSKLIGKNEEEYHCINGHIIFTRIGEAKPSDQDERDSYLRNDDELLGLSRVAFILEISEDTLRQIVIRDN